MTEAEKVASIVPSYAVAMYRGDSEGLIRWIVREMGAPLRLAFAVVAIINADN